MRVACLFGWWRLVPPARVRCQASSAMSSAISMRSPNGPCLTRTSPTHRIAAMSGTQNDEAPPDKPRLCDVCEDDPATHVCDDCNEAMCQVGDMCAMFARSHMCCLLVVS